MKKSKSKPQLQVTRRQALAFMGSCALAPALLDPVQALIDGLVHGLIDEAQAQAAPDAVKPRNYVYVNLPGGPARWYWDLPLRPYGTGAAIVRNAHVNTRFANAGTNAGAPEYVSLPVTRQGVTLQMPYLWSQSIPTPTGTVPMANLLDHMLMINGVNLGVDGHPDNNDKQVRPLISAPSLGGMVADGSSTPIPAVGLPNSPDRVYKSSRGIGQVVVDAYSTGSNPLSQILSPFNRANDGLTAGYLSRRQAMDAAIQRALTSLGRYSQSNSPGASALFEVRNRAEGLLRQGIGDAANSYTQLFNKYQALVAYCATNALPGINDKPVRYSDLFVTNGYTPQTSIQEGFIRNADVRTVIQANSNLSSLAQGFAVAEYLLVNKLSSTVMLGSGRVTNLLFENWSDRDTPAVNNGTNTQGIWGYDEHFGGSVLSVLINTFLFRALSACLYEFIGVLKQNQIFNETVVHVGSEFSRNPRQSQGGSDHGWNANVSSVFSGTIRQPCVVGNTAATSNFSGNSPGTWGAAAKVRVDGADQHLTIGHSTSTIAKLLRVKPILPNNGALVQENATGVGITPVVELATLKDEE